VSSIYKRDNVWYIQIFENGIQKQKSLRTKDAKIAKAKKKKIDAQIELGLLRTGNAKILIKEAFQSYLTRKQVSLKPSSLTRYKIFIDNLKLYFEQKNVLYLHHITDDMLSDYVASRQTKKASNKTIIDELAVMKAVYNQFRDTSNLINIKIWPKLKKTPKKPDTLDGYTKDEIKKILKYFENTEKHPYLMTLIYTGCRSGELSALKKSDVNFQEGYIKIGSSKTASNYDNQTRDIEIHEKLLPILQEACKDIQPHEYIFSKERAGDWLRRAISKACKELSIPYKRLHGLRHTFISTILNNGVPLRIAMEMAGHTNFSTTLKYSHISQNDVKGKINKLDF